MPPSATPERYIEYLEKLIDNRVNIAGHLLQEYAPQCMVVVLESTDRVQHFFWKHPADWPQAEVQAGREALHRVYKKADAAVGQLIARVGAGTTVVLVSDHGAGPYRKLLLQNTWLRQIGLLHFRNGVSRRLENLENKNRLYGASSAFLKGLVPVGLKKAIRARMPHSERASFWAQSVSNVDWSRTKVYAVGQDGKFYVNLRGREPGGIVPEHEREQVLDFLVDQAQKLVDPDTGQCAVKNIYRREEIYSGARISEAPDVVIEWVQDYHAKELEQSDRTRVFADVDRWVGSQLNHTGNHRRKGIFSVRGPGIKSGVTLEGACLRDIAPTAMHLMGQPVPGDMDGKVLDQIFTQEFLDTHPIVQGHSEGPMDDAGEQASYTPEEMKRLEETLRKLGYL
jgi:predicted AlkP superfamily phosphohydrolase/phosphomutase